MTFQRSINLWTLLHVYERFKLQKINETINKRNLKKVLCKSSLTQCILLVGELPNCFIVFTASKIS